VTWALGLPGCFLGGQTGSASETFTPQCARSLTLAYEQTSSLGYSAAAMLTALGGTRTATVSAWDDGFWQKLGVDPEPEPPLSLVLSLQHDSRGGIIANECSSYLAIPVTVSLDVGNGLLERVSLGTLQGTRESAALTLQLGLVPDAGDAGSEADIQLEVQITPERVRGEIMVDGSGTPTATFDSAP
jgi:hypothetical protein